MLAVRTLIDASTVP